MKGKNYWMKNNEMHELGNKIRERKIFWEKEKNSEKMG